MYLGISLKTRLELFNFYIWQNRSVLTLRQTRYSKSTKKPFYLLPQRISLVGTGKTQSSTESDSKKSLLCPSPFPIHTPAPTRNRPRPWVDSGPTARGRTPKACRLQQNEGIALAATLQRDGILKEISFYQSSGVPFRNLGRRRSATLLSVWQGYTLEPLVSSNPVTLPFYYPYYRASVPLVLWSIGGPLSHCACRLPLIQAYTSSRTSTQLRCSIVVLH